jgi:DNA-binding response OmpR family regulator
LTARSGGQDRIKGLDEGGDDYISKPFELNELLARIKSLFRRQDWFRGRETPQVLWIGQAEINLRAYQAITPSGPVVLKEKEVMILRLLSEYAGEPVTRETILDRVWGFGAYPTTRTVDNFILSLRKIVEQDPRKPQHILTVHGVGYRLVLKPSRQDV